MKLGFKHRTILYFFLGFICIPPDIFRLYPILRYINEFLRYTGVLIEFGLIYYFVMKRKKWNLLFLTTALFMGWLLFCDFMAGDFRALFSLFFILVRIFGYMCVVLMAYTNGKKADFLDGTSSYCAMVCSLNFASQIWFQDGIYHDWTQSWQPYFVCGNANSFVFFYIFSMNMLVQRSLLKKRSISPFVIIMNIVMIFSAFLGGTTTGTAVMILSLCFLLAQIKPIVNFITQHNVQLMILAFMIVFWFLVLGGWKNSRIIFLVKTFFNEDLSYYGRGVIWASAVSNILAHPLIGYGSGKTNLNVDLDGRLRSAHNSFLQIALYGGIVALVLYIVIIYIATKGLRNVQSKSAYFSFVTIILFLIAFMFEQNPLYIGMFVSLLILSCETGTLNYIRK